MALLLRNLRKSYRSPDGQVSTVLNVPEFALADGEQVALIGSSGSGKTTLLHCIAGILSPDSGQVLFGSDESLHTASADVTDLAQLAEAQRDVFRGSHIGYVFQTHHLLPGLTALENVLLGMSFTGTRADPQHARHLLNEVGLSDRANYRPAQLSIGQQQRVAVARALASRPMLVLADEPTGALDTDNARQVMTLIRNLCRTQNASLLLVTHDQTLAASLDRVVDLKAVNQPTQRTTNN